MVALLMCSTRSASPAVGVDPEWEFDYGGVEMQNPAQAVETEDICFDDNGINTKENQKKSALSAEQIALNWEIWMKWEKYAQSFCAKHALNCSADADLVLSQAMELFVSNNQSEKVSSRYIILQCLMAARQLGHYTQKNRKTKYKGDGRFYYTPENADEAQVIKLVKDNILSIDYACEMFNVTNPACIDYLRKCLDEYTCPDKSFISFDDFGKNNSKDSCADNYIPALQVEPCVLIDQPADHYLASDFIKQAAQNFLAGISYEDQAIKLKMSQSAFIERIEADVALIKEDMELEDKELFGTYTPTLVSLEQLQNEEYTAADAADKLVDTSVIVEPVTQSQVVPAAAPDVIDYKSYAMVSPFYIAAVEAKEAGKSVKELAEAVGMSPSAFRGKIKRQENWIKKVQAAGQMCFNFEDMAPAPEAEPVVEAVAQVAEVLPIPEALVINENQEMVVAVVPAKIPSIVDVVKSLLRPVRWLGNTISAMMFEKAFSGASCKRLRMVADRGSGPGLMAA